MPEHPYGPIEIVHVLKGAVKIKREKRKCHSYTI